MGGGGLGSTGPEDSERRAGAGSTRERRGKLCISVLTGEVIVEALTVLFPLEEG